MARLQKLHRSQNHRILAGVLGGIAEYLGWTPTAVRLLFWAVIIFSAGVTLPVAALAYGVMWILMPEATAQSYIAYNQPNLLGQNNNQNENNTTTHTR